MAFLVGGAAAEQGKNVAMFLTKEAVRIGLPGYADGVACDGCPPLAGLFQQYADNGGQLFVCPIASARGSSTRGLSSGTRSWPALRRCGSGWATRQPASSATDRREGVSEKGAGMTMSADTGEQTEALVERLFTAVIDTLEVASVHLGGRLGLYRALAEGGDATSAELAARTGTAERYMREWLEQQAVAGFLTVDDTDADAAARRYGLPPPTGRCSSRRRTSTTSRRLPPSPSTCSGPWSSCWPPTAPATGSHSRLRRRSR